MAAFQAGWLACVGGAARGHPWVGPLAAALIVPVHIMLQARRARELSLVLAAGAIGLVVDTALRAVGAIDYAGWGPAGMLPPLWLPALWMLFATTLGKSLAWLHRRAALAALSGALAGPASYALGARMGAIELGESLPASLLALAIAWAAVLPMLTTMSRRGER